MGAADSSEDPVEALRLVAERAVDVDEERGLALAHDLCARLSQGSARERLELAESLRLPVSARWLGKGAAPLLRLLVEDETLRPFFADPAARLWLELDLHDALPAALGIADDVNSMTLLALAATVEREEAFEFLSARFARDAFFAELLSRTGAKLIDGDDRWVPLAMSRLEGDPEAALRLLERVATPRAAEELAGIAEHAERIDDTALAALLALCASPHVDVLGAPTLASLLHKRNAHLLLTWQTQPLQQLYRRHRRAIEDAIDGMAGREEPAATQQARALFAQALAGLSR